MKLLKKSANIMLVLTLIFSMTIGVFATETVVPTKPDDYYVYDMAEVINDVTSQEITLLNTDELAEYGEIIIVTITSSGDTALSDYAEELFDTWEIGGESSTGALLLMDIEGDNYRSIVGSGFSSYVSESQLKDILDGQVEYYFDSKDYDSAASIFVSAISSKLMPTDSSTDDEASTDDSTTDDLEAEDVIVEETVEEDEAKTNSFGSVMLAIFKVILVIILILLIIVVGFLILVNIKSQKRRKNRKGRRNTNNKK